MLKQNLKTIGTTLATGVGLGLFHWTAFAQGTGFISGQDNPSRIAAQTGGEGSARNLILTIVNFFLGFLGLLAVLMVIYGGILVLTAAGEPEKAGKGKKILLYAAIGIVIILLSFAIVNTVFQAGTGQDA